jgi:GTPase SAR1 family protein
MKASRDFLRLTTFLAAIASVLLLVVAYVKVIDLDSSYFTIMIGGALGVLTSTYVGFFLRTLNKNPTPLKTAIIGLPRSGKTVYLSVLFNELQLYKAGAVSFQPYGMDTIEMVEKNLKKLHSGIWLRPTAPDSVFYFRANAHIKGGLFEKKYTVEIGDYAGEKSREFDSSSDEWLHKTDYFRYVIASDIIFLAIDGSLIAENDVRRLQDSQSSLVAAMQVLLDEKGIAFGSKLDVPVAMIILKSDLLSAQYDVFKSGYFNRLISLCTNRCTYFEVFQVSSVGRVDEQGNPAASMEPLAVTSPMIWALTKLRL